MKYEAMSNDELSRLASVPPMDVDELRAMLSVCATRGIELPEGLRERPPLRKQAMGFLEVVTWLAIAFIGGIASIVIMVFLKKTQPSAPAVLTGLAVFLGVGYLIKWYFKSKSRKGS